MARQAHDVGGGKTSDWEPSDRRQSPGIKRYLVESNRSDDLKLGISKGSRHGGGRAATYLNVWDQKWKEMSDSKDSKCKEALII